MLGVLPQIRESVGESLAQCSSDQAGASDQAARPASHPSLCLCCAHCQRRAGLLRPQAAHALCRADQTELWRITRCLTRSDDSLKKYTIDVADTGDIEAIGKAKPQDATTNPSLVFKAAQQPQYKHLVEEALAYSSKQPGDQTAQTMAFMDKLFVNFGCEILKLIPGRVSTEVDASFSFDTAGSIDKARTLIKLYESAGVDRQRILIKLGSTWEGIKAAEQLEKENIHTNLTLLFIFAQAVACAEAKVTLISPFVGRIYDWYKKSKGVADIPREEDPGVSSVVRIYNYYKKHGYKTQVMGARLPQGGSDHRPLRLRFAHHQPRADQRAWLARRRDRTEVDCQDRRSQRDSADPPRRGRPARFEHNQDQMAVEKLSEGIRSFYADARKLEQYARKRSRQGERGVSRPLTRRHGTTESGVPTSARRARSEQPAHRREERLR